MESWRNLQNETQLAEISQASFNKIQIIFKHSTTCGISAQAQYRLFSSTEELVGNADLYYLDLHRYRPVSNLVAQTFGIPHQSPQVIVIKEGKAIYDSSHFAINPSKLAELTDRTD